VWWLWWCCRYLMSVSSVFLLVVQFGMFETVLSALFDRYPFLRAKKICVTAVISVTEFLLGLLLVCNVSLRHVLFVHRISYWVAAYGLKLALTLTTLLSLTNTHTHTRLTALCPRLPGWAGTRKVKPIWIYWSKRRWVAVASAGPSGSLHLDPDR